MSIKKSKYEPEDLPSHKKMDEELSAFDLVLKINGFLSKVGFGSNKLSEIKPQIEELKKQKNDLIQYSTKYNRYFSEKGWIAYDSMNFEIIQKAVDLYEENCPNEAEEVIKNYYSPFEIESRFIYFRHIPEFQVRIRFLKYALQDYKDEKYYSVIPLLLMVIDGVVNDVMQKGFHAENLDLAVWDSVISTDFGIQKIKEIFTRSRKKTNTEIIDLPYRNGILHGRDLSYDNYTVACKSWAFVFFIRDWINSKKSEKDRFEKYIEKSRVKSFSELAKDLKELDKLRAALSAWKPREIEDKYIEQINIFKSADEKEPESLVFDFLDYWKNKNYGKMSESFSKLITDNYKKYAAEVRNNYKDLPLEEYEIIQIIDEAPAISEIIVKLNCFNSPAKKVNFRCLYEKNFVDSIPRGFQEGSWKIVFLQDI